MVKIRERDEWRRGRSSILRAIKITFDFVIRTRDFLRSNLLFVFERRRKKTCQIYQINKNYCNDIVMIYIYIYMRIQKGK